MIVKENITLNGKEFIRTISDVGLTIRKVGTDEVYSEAVDLPESDFEYEETSEKIEE